MNVLVNNLFAIKLSDQKDNIFSVPEYLKSNVDFWYKIYSFWDTNQVIFHDSKSFLIYHVLELPKIEGEISSFKFFSEVVKTKDEIKQILKLIQQKKEPENKTALYLSIKEKVYKFSLQDEDLASTLRNQSGLKSLFRNGLSLSGRHYDEMTTFLEAKGFPKELISAVLVESIFSSEAVSKVGASGFWGIMKATAPSLGIIVNNLVDERNDPVLSTKAAAAYFEQSKKKLEKWPLIITSYNYGISGMARACASLDTDDLGKIIEQHQSPIFGFASKNYYAEFLAAKLVLDNHKAIFPNLKKEEQWKYDLVEVSHAVALSDVFTYKGITRAEISKFNPALSTKALNGKEVLPKGFSLRVPKGKAKIFADIVKKIPDKKKQASSLLVSTKYRSTGKETLALIAKKHAISLDFLLNRFNKPASYKPKGVVLIRSMSNLFTSLKETLALIENKNKS